MPASQADTLQLFTALYLLRKSWAGSLLLGIGLDDSGRSLALASLAAGAASLFLEEDAASLRAAQREGVCTFAVTTLDEALRALKNEVRQGRAISVALGGSVAHWLAEMVDRGVLPQATATTRALSGEERSSLTTLQGWGAVSLGGFGLTAAVGESTDLQAVLHPAITDQWQVVESVATTLAERRTQDVALLAGIEGDDVVAEAARVWLRTAPSLFPRALHRAHW